MRMDGETDEEYADRQLRIKAYTEKWKAEQKPILEAKKKKERKEHRIAIVKQVTRLTVKTSLWTMSVGLGFFTISRGYAYYGAVTQGLLNFEENKNYTANTSREAGYYNAHPVTVCISNQFDHSDMKRIRSGVEYFDSCAKGITFKISTGKTGSSDANIKISPENLDENSKHKNKNTAAYASVGSLTTDQISGRMVLDTGRINDIDVKSVVAHELGHIIGMTHSKNPNSLMYPVKGRWTFSRKDKEIINTIYPDRNYKDTTTSQVDTEANYIINDNYTDILSHIQKNKENDDPEFSM